ncbi:hypothetical protein KY290_013442 [Solanum tuberosum]|uniref:Uncharacterized protein n=1 Tax=Solanum tuberosum TaxID=4113 RepID=A0ABQ7VLP4_SOLTU|nr:hypothetical protein KY290_013442 [Solanum tuberosum]
MTSKSQCNEEAVHEREQEIQKDTAKKRDKSKGHGQDEDSSDTSQLSEKIIGVEAAIEGLDEVKDNLIELGEENKEGLTNFELKLTKVISSLHREFEALKAQVEQATITGVAAPILFLKPVLKLLNQRSFVNK